jgi:hypothetical protein
MRSAAPSSGTDFVRTVSTTASRNSDSGKWSVALPDWLATGDWIPPRFRFRAMTPHREHGSTEFAHTVIRWHTMYPEDPAIVIARGSQRRGSKLLDNDKAGMCERVWICSTVVLDQLQTHGDVQATEGSKSLIAHYLMSRNTTVASRNAWYTGRFPGPTSVVIRSMHGTSMRKQINELP